MQNTYMLKKILIITIIASFSDALGAEKLNWFKNKENQKIVGHTTGFFAGSVLTGMGIGTIGQISKHANDEYFANRKFIYTSRNFVFDRTIRSPYICVPLHRVIAYRLIAGPSLMYYTGKTLLELLSNKYPKLQNKQK